MRWLLQSELYCPNHRTKKGFTALHLASTPEMATVLLEAGADPYMMARPGKMIPLHFAVARGQRDIVEVFLKRGVMPVPVTGGLSPLNLAVIQKDWAMADLLKRSVITRSYDQP